MIHGYRATGITRQDFSNDILDSIYGPSDYRTVDHIHPHRLAVFFGLMATGVSRSFEPDAMQQAERYHVLACAALSLTPLIAEAMTATIQAVFLINAFLCTTILVSVEESWLLIGLCARLAYRVRKQISSSPVQHSQRRYSSPDRTSSVHSYA